MKKGQQRYVIFGILKCNTHIKESIHEIRQAKKNFEKGGTQAKAQLCLSSVPAVVMDMTGRNRFSK